ncbi:MAG: hypothetical protein IAF38_06680, partial [Bacteroidia bacterium]|nr:hypothetical protein [Bacteroidia bacterium]
MNFNIPIPCEEDYSKMAPVEGGVFCKSCEKKVHDLTQKNNIEIKDFFEEQKGAKSCIRIANTQILELNFDGFFSKFRLWNLRKKIAVIIYLFFGIGITSCDDEYKMGKAKKENNLVEAEKINWEETKYSLDRNTYGADYIEY